MKDIPNYEGLYAITEDGKVWSYATQSYLNYDENNKGYYRVKLYKDGIAKNYWFID